MIRFEQLSVTYAGAETPALRTVDAHVEEGELCLVVGPTGSGKSTLLGAACARVPHFSGGLLAGRVLVEGRDTRDHLPRDLADVVGVVGQDPLAGFVTDTVEEELAYGMEQLGVRPALMRTRVEEVIDLLGLAGLRGRPLSDLSGGEQQRVAIGAVMTAQPRVLVLDEPTSALDPTAAEEVLGALARLVHDLGVTVLLAEHRLERVVQFADRVIALRPDGAAVHGEPADVLATAAVAPPIVELGRLAGWDPLPLSVRDARRRAAPLRERLTGAGGGPATVHADAGSTGTVPAGAGSTGTVPAGAGSTGTVPTRAVPVRTAPTRAVPAGTAPTRTVPPEPLLAARRVHVRHGRTHAVRGVDLDLRAGEVVALMGRNGSGKSSLLWALQGQGPRSAGTVTVRDVRDVRGDSDEAARGGRNRPRPGLATPAGAAPRAAESGPGPAGCAGIAQPVAGTRARGRGAGAEGASTLDPASLRPAEARRHVTLVPQSPSDLLYLPTVAAECAAGDAQAGAHGGATRALLDRLVPGVAPEAHPSDLSEGQRLALALAVQLAAGPAVVLLDEPTRGLDYAAKDALARVLGELAAAGRAVLLSSHDVEFVAGCAGRVLVLADGEVVADDAARTVLAGSPAFAPQVAKILRPLDLLTVPEVRAALASGAGSGHGAAPTVGPGAPTAASGSVIDTPANPGAAP